MFLQDFVRLCQNDNLIIVDQTFDGHLNAFNVFCIRCVSDLSAALEKKTNTFSLVVFYIAPVSLLMGLIDLRRSAAPPDSPSRRPARMAILNSAFAIAAFLVTLGVLFGTGALRWAS